MGHHCCSKQKVKRGLWSPEEDEKLIKYITAHGHACWSAVPKLAGLQRCGKSCRLRWINYLKPDVKRGRFSDEEERIIIDVHRIVGNRWAQIAKHLPGRTDNEVKNFWNSCIKKKLIAKGLDPNTHNLISPNTNTNTKSQQPTSLFSIDKNPAIHTKNMPPPPTLFNDQNSSLIKSFQCGISNDTDTDTANATGLSWTDETTNQHCSSGVQIDNCFMNSSFGLLPVSVVETRAVKETIQFDGETTFENSSFNFDFVDSTLVSSDMLSYNMNPMDDLSWSY